MNQLNPPTNSDIAYIMRLAQADNAQSQYYTDMIPVVVDHINTSITKPFEGDFEELPSSVKFFIAQTISFFSTAAFGLESESVSGVSFSYNYDKLPGTITNLLEVYGYNVKKVKFIPMW